MKDDVYFFAPRPKLPRRWRFIRGCAICLGILVGLAFAPIYYSIGLALLRGLSGGVFSAMLLQLLVAMLGELLLLIPVWRLYDLRRWACCLLMSVTMLLAVSLFLVFVTGIVWALSLMLLALILIWLLSEEYPHLKPGF